MTLVDDTSTQRRLPSQRPINHRWDQSRGIAPGTNKDNGFHDFRWSSKDPILFAKSPASSRGYAVRSILGNRGDTKPTSQTQTRDTRGSKDDTSHEPQAWHDDDLVNQPDRISASYINRKEEHRQQIETVKAAKDVEIAAKEVEIQRLRNDQAMSARQMQEHDLQLKGRDVALKQSEAAFSQKTAAKEAELKQWETRLSGQEAGYKARVAEAERNAIDVASRAVEDIKKTADEETMQAKDQRRQAVELKNEAAQLRQAAETDKINQARHYQKTLQDAQTENSAELDKQMVKLEKEMDRRLGEQMRLVRQRRLDREDEWRQDYDSYRQIWDQLWLSSKQLINQTSSTIVNLPEHSDEAKVDSVKFDGIKVHPTFSQKYPQLSTRLLNYFNSEISRLPTPATALTTLNQSLIDQQSDLRLSSHTSRLLTRFHRFNEKQGSYDMNELVHTVQHDVPLSQFDRWLRKQRMQLGSALRRSPTRREREQLTVLESNEQRLIQFFGFNVALRQFEALKALQQSTIYEKAAFLQTEQAETHLDQAKRLSFLSMEAQAQDRGQVASRTRKGLLTEYNSKYKDARGEVQEHHDFVLKRSLLKAHLERADQDEEELDAEIAKRLDNAKRSAYERLGKIGRTEPPSTRSQITSLRPLSTSRSSSTSQPRSTSPASVLLPGVDVRVEILVKKLKDPDAYPTEEAKHRAQAELRELKCESASRQLAILEEKRKRSEPDSRVSELLGKEIEGINNFITKLKSSSVGSSSTIDVINKEQSSPDASQTHRVGSRQRNPIRRARAFRRQNASDDGPAEENHAVAGGGGVNFTQTAARHAWKPLWLDRFRPSRTEEGKVPLTSSTSDTVTEVSDKESALDNTSLSQAHDASSLHSSYAENEKVYTTSEKREGYDTAQSASASSDGQDDIYSPSQSATETMSDGEVDASWSALTDAEETASVPTSTPFIDPIASTSDAETISVVQSDTNLSYEISSEEYRKAVLASKNTSAAFWSHKLYKNAEGKTPSVHYCTNYETTEAQAKQFSDESVLGFDLEWEYGATPEKSGIKNSVSLVQISSESRIGLFHLALFKGDKPEELMPPSLQALLETGGIAKVGVNVSGDALRIEKCFGFKMTGLFELSHLYNVVVHSESSPEKVTKRLFNLADQVQNILLLPLMKGDVRTSAWSKRLRTDQTDYAASDAYAGFRLYHALEGKRRKMDPMPPRPAFWEERKPLVFGNGKVVVARKNTAARREPVGAVLEEGDDECEEYFDALETQDPSSETGGVPLSGILDVAYPTLPSSDHITETTTKTAQEQQTSSPANLPPASTPQTPKPPPTKRSHPPISPQVTLADSWAQHFRTTSYNLKCGHATLRAYHLWHQQHFDIEEVAAFLRDPPLRLQTVANYVMQALNEEDLPFEEPRARMALELLPKSVHGRYWRVVGRMVMVGEEDAG